MWVQTQTCMRGWRVGAHGVARESTQGTTRVTAAWRAHRCRSCHSPSETLTDSERFGAGWVHLALIVQLSSCQQGTPQKGTDMNRNENTSTTTAAEAFNQLHAELIAADMDVELVEDPTTLTDNIRVWHSANHDIYTLIAPALDEDGAEFPGFNWTDYEVVADGADDDIHSDYSETVAEVVDDMAAKTN